MIYDGVVNVRYVLEIQSNTKVQESELINLYRNQNQYLTSIEQKTMDREFLIKSCFNYEGELISDEGTFFIYTNDLNRVLEVEPKHTTLQQAIRKAIRNRNINEILKLGKRG